MAEQVTLVVLISLLGIATYTDVRWQKIFNWNTYSGFILAFVLRYWSGGQAGFEDSIKGFAICGGLMLVCFLLFGLGGGDLKLIAMMGAFLGFEAGVESLLWTLVLGGIFGGSLVVWQIGFVNIVSGCIKHIVKIVRARTWVPLANEDQKPLKQTLFLAPAAFIATMIVTWDRWTRLFVFLK